MQQRVPRAASQRLQLPAVQVVHGQQEKSAAGAWPAAATAAAAILHSQFGRCGAPSMPAHRLICLARPTLYTQKSATLIYQLRAHCKLRVIKDACGVVKVTFFTCVEGWQGGGEGKQTSNVTAATVDTRSLPLGHWLLSQHALSSTP